MMGRIATEITITNVFDSTQRMECSALVDTGASDMILPMAWKDKLGQLTEVTGSFQLANNTEGVGIIGGPVSMQISGFRSFFGEVIFIEMDPPYEPLIGYIPLEKSRIIVDMVGHRLVGVKHFDLK